MEGEDINSIPDSYSNVRNQDPEFMKWFLDISSPIHKLRYEWKGWVEDVDGTWIEPKDAVVNRMMNERGINWCINQLKTYTSNAFQSSNFNEEHMNKVMRDCARVVFRGIRDHFKDFGYSKADYRSICTKIMHTIQAVILSSRADGNRLFLTKTHSVSEVKQSNPNENRGMFSGISGSIFGNKGN